MKTKELDQWTVRLKVYRSNNEILQISCSPSFLIYSYNMPRRKDLALCLSHLFVEILHVFGVGLSLQTGSWDHLKNCFVNWPVCISNLVAWILEFTFSNLQCNPSILWSPAEDHQCKLTNPENLPSEMEIMDPLTWITFQHQMRCSSIYLERLR